MKSKSNSKNRNEMLKRQGVGIEIQYKRCPMASDIISEEQLEHLAVRW